MLPIVKNEIELRGPIFDGFQRRNTTVNKFDEFHHLRSRDHRVVNAKKQSILLV